MRVHRALRAVLLMADWPAVPQAAPAAKVGPIDLSATGIWAMVQRNRDVYWKTWKTNFLPPLLEPFLYLVAFGYGLGAFVATFDGVPTRQFVAPGILAITIMQGAFFETTYNSFVRMWFQKTWDAITATPLTIDDVLVGELVWAALKAALNATLMAAVILAFGLFPWTFLVVAPVVGFVGGLLFAGLGLMVSAKVKAIDGFSFAIYLFITPMMLLAGTFYPIDRYPVVVQQVAYAFPLTNLVHVLRVAAYESDPDVWLNLVYLVAGALLFPMIAVRWMKKKLIV